MKKIIIALIVGHILTASYAVLWLFGSKVPTIRANLFLDQSIMPEGIELAWYVKFISIYLLFCITYFCFAKVIFVYNRKLFFVVSIFGVYHTIDLICFLVNFSQSWWLYIVLALLIGMAIVFALLPIKEKAKIISLEE